MIIISSSSTPLYFRLLFYHFNIYIYIYRYRLLFFKRVIIVIIIIASSSRLAMLVVIVVCFSCLLVLFYHNYTFYTIWHSNILITEIITTHIYLPVAFNGLDWRSRAEWWQAPCVLLILNTSASNWAGQKREKIKKNTHLLSYADAYRSRHIQLPPEPSM